MRPDNRSSALIVSLCLLVLSGCAEFRSSKRLDMGPFGENTSAMVASIKQGLTIKRPVLTQAYLQGDSVDEYIKQKNEIGRILSGIVLYSTQVVTLSRSALTGKEQASELAKFVTRLGNPVIEKKDPDIRITQEKFDSMVKYIGAQETLLDALGAAQPLVDAVDTYVGNALNNMNGLVGRIAAETANRIYLNSAEVLGNRDVLEAQQDQFAKNLTLLISYRSGDAEALNSVLKSDPTLRRYVNPGEKVSPQNLDAMEKDQMARLQEIHILLEQLKPRIDKFHAEILELDEMVRLVEENIRKMRIAVILWSRSHSNLAAGVAVPPQIDLAGMLSGATSKAVQSAVP